MTEVPETPRGGFDWLLAKPVVHEFQVPLPNAEPGVEQTLKVVITAKATVTPNRSWGTFLVVWASIVVGLMAAIAINTAHGATWEDQNAQRRAPAWGQQNWAQPEPGVTTTYRDTVAPDGSAGRCALYQWRGEPRIDCRH
jgi:hypothetical protein